jgi:hypothetical protein
MDGAGRLAAAFGMVALLAPGVAQAAAGDATDAEVWLTETDSGTRPTSASTFMTRSARWPIAPPGSPSARTCA